ncbi:acetate/propionate family kinase [Saccharospirillum impatiens]|uniref:acetate/propionate family kinase n=1 Tax=Saccharospirillum impatiens TaxID=169438 RepID=UPI0004113890|nr:acetate kinase [Saccharospirillum impatiens]
MAAVPVLVINSGSSSLKFSLFDMTDGHERLSGFVDRLNTLNAELTWHLDGKKHTRPLPGHGHSGALQAVNDIVIQLALNEPLTGIGHRVVHGGETFTDSVAITDVTLRGIEACSNLAPLHNPANVLGIQVMQALYPSVPQVAVFDTAFHQSLDPEAFLYAVPMALYREHGVRRYGFHGTSHQYVAQQAVRQLGLDPESHAIISAHLGNGCSATAISDGFSIDTTMGMTPLEGLVMGTRSGDIDPGLHEYLSEQLGWSIADVTLMLNRDSGLRGLSELSNDMRTLTEAADRGHRQAQQAIDVFCFRLARQIGGLAASLGRLDALVFTGGIGENAANIRANVLQRLSIFGFKLDDELNQAQGDEFGRISAGQGPIAAVIPTREEWMIAQDTLRLVCDNSNQ